MLHRHAGWPARVGVTSYAPRDDLECPTAAASETVAREKFNSDATDWIPAPVPIRSLQHSSETQRGRSAHGSSRKIISLPCTNAKCDGAAETCARPRQGIVSDETRGYEKCSRKAQVAHDRRGDRKAVDLGFVKAMHDSPDRSFALRRGRSRKRQPLHLGLSGQGGFG
ncbi:MAG: hypothetical protein JWM95_4924 [Gemmatimonadetes bacterium]|nr:hypothetical protein [Gemmatimonadota bacterium]